MSTLIAILLLLPLAQGGNSAPAGDAQAGQVWWAAASSPLCIQCHGAKGEGAFGPDLAGRSLSVEQYKQAIRKPWGLMPAFVEHQISDQDIANIQAYFTGLPKVAQRAAYRIPLPANAPLGQQLALDGVGCGQCHGATLNGPRTNAGAIGADFSWFQRMVYEHTTVMPQHRTLLAANAGFIRMGNYSRTRVPESVLRDVWAWINDLGFRVPIAGQLSAGATTGNSTTYTLTVTNNGLAGKGLTAEGLTIALRLAPGATVASTTGTGYQGVRADPQAKVDTAVWQVPRLAPKDKQAFTITLSSSAPGKDVTGGTVQFAKPALKDGPGEVNIAAPPPPTQTR